RPRVVGGGPGRLGPGLPLREPAEPARQNRQGQFTQVTSCPGITACAEKGTRITSRNDPRPLCWPLLAITSHDERLAAWSHSFSGSDPSAAVRRPDAFDS